MQATLSKNIYQDLKIFLLLSVFAGSMGYVIAQGGLNVAGLYLALPFALAFLFVIFQNPKRGLLFCLHLGFISGALSRFFPASIPFNLFFDGLLLLTIIACFFKKGREGFVKMNTWVFYLMLLWFVFTVIQLANPESGGGEAWFFGVRGISLYGVQLVPLILILMSRRADMEQVIRIWIGWSILAALYGFKMQFFGVTEVERTWLNKGGGITHEILGRLRIFSFYSDAGQFGAAMAHTALLALILATGPYAFKKKVFYWIFFALCVGAYVLAGGRGPLLLILSGGVLCSGK